MNKLFVLLISISFIYSSTYGQAHYALNGSVVDEHNHPLIGASIVLQPGNLGTITDINGQYVINQVLEGQYSIDVSYIGYSTLHDSITVDRNQTYDFELEISTINLQEINVSDHHAETRIKETALNIEVVNDDYLKQNLGGSLMKSLERLPGVTTIDIGSGQSKPVIRGLGFNRVVVVENNIKHEAQQWGADHGLEIDQYTIDNIEVTKGPASLMYGSDAIGGIIDLKNRHLPTEQTFSGTIDLTGKTNNNFLGASASMSFRRHSFYATARGTFLSYGDYKVPTDSVEIYSYNAALYNNHLRNTAGKEQDLHASFGVIKNHFQSKFFVSNINNKSGFFANAHGLEPRSVNTDLHDKSSRDIQYPYQHTKHFKITNSTYYQWDQLKVEFDLGFQRNYRQEWSQYVQHGYMPAIFPDTIDFKPDLERQFEKYVYSGLVKFAYQFNAANQLHFGINSEHQNNKIDGRGFIIPAYKQFSVGGFILAKHHFSDKSLIQAGIRYDYGHITTSAYYDWFPSPVVDYGDTTLQYLQRASQINRNFSNLTWSVGYNFNTEKWMFKTNIGKSFRMPIAKELAANGVNYHRFSYEVGDAKLSPEIAYQFDAGFKYRNKKIAIGATPFINYFTNYIYLNPTANHDRLYGNGNQVYNYTESKVLRYGGELHAHYEVFKWLKFGVIGEYVYSKQMSGNKKGYTLPFSPPLSFIFNVKFQKEKLSGRLSKAFENAYLSIDCNVTAAQNKIVPPEKTTDGYQIVNLSFGSDIKLKNQKVSISMQVHNLLNTQYFNHTSYYRLINVPEPSSNFIVNISYPYTIKLNKKENPKPIQ